LRIFACTNDVNSGVFSQRFESRPFHRHLPITLCPRIFLAREVINHTCGRDLVYDDGRSRYLPRLKPSIANAIAGLAQSPTCGALLPVRRYDGCPSRALDHAGSPPPAGAIVLFVHRHKEAVDRRLSPSRSHVAAPFSARHRVVLPDFLSCLLRRVVPQRPCNG
jgi:hypothetical protein